MTRLADSQLQTMKTVRRKREILDVLDTALAKIHRSEIQPLSDHDREWARAIRYWLAGADDEEAVRLVICERENDAAGR